MKYLKLFESYNPIRDEIEANIKFILLELQDCKSHYKSKIVWDVPWSYIYITGEKKGVFGIHKPIFSEVQPIIGEIVAYLDSEGFQTTVKYKPDKENCREFFIYILPENIKVNESFNIDGIKNGEVFAEFTIDGQDYSGLVDNYKFNEVKGEIEDIKFILQDLKDDGWIVDVDLVVKRWENPAANFHIKSDYIKVYIKKTDCNRSRYPLDAEFNFNIIEDEIRHILSIYKDNEIDIKMCFNDTEWEESLDRQHIPRRDYLRGIWSGINTDLFIKSKLIGCGKFTGYSYNTEILGIELNIYLNTNNIDQIKDKPNINESFNIDEDSEHLKDLSLDLKDEGEWSINVYTNTEKYNDDEYSCKVILEPLDEFDWDADTNRAGAKINDTMIQYLEDIVKYMEDYDYKIIICDTDQDPFFDRVRQNTIVLENLEKFNQWIKKEIGYQGKTKSTEVGDSIVLSTEYPDFLNFGYKGDFIIIEFYEKDDLF